MEAHHQEASVLQGRTTDFSAYDFLLVIIEWRCPRVPLRVSVRPGVVR